MIINDVVKFIKTFEDTECTYPIKAIIAPGHIVEVSQSQYVIGGEYLLFELQLSSKNSRKEPYINTLDKLKSNLEREAFDSCWKPDIDSIFEDGRSEFTDCTVCFVTGNADSYIDCKETDDYAVYEVRGITLENGVIYLHCEEDFEVEDDPNVLNQEEYDMLERALEYYGNKIADSEGASSGEKYWDLKEKIQRIRQL